MGAMFLASALNRGIHPPEILKNGTNTGGEMLLFRALAKNMAPMTNADESPTNRLTLFWLNISLFIVSTLLPLSVKVQNTLPPSERYTSLEPSSFELRDINIDL